MNIKEKRKKELGGEGNLEFLIVKPTGVCIQICKIKIYVDIQEMSRASVIKLQPSSHPCHMILAT
jgi:hypothetical protein